MDLGGAGPHQRALRWMERLNAFGGGVLTHGLTFVLGFRHAEWRVVRTRFNADRTLGAGFIDDVDRTDPTLREALHFARPTRGDVARLHPMVNHCPIQLERARYLGLAAEEIDQL